MGKRNKRARTILKRMSILGEVPSLETARRLGIEKQAQAELDRRQSIIDEENRIKAEAEAKRLAAEKAAEEKKRAEEKARKEAEAKAKAEAEKKKAADAKKKKAPAAKKKIEVEEPKD